jgi:ubiquinone biosynthesis protein UbiJ
MLTVSVSREFKEKLKNLAENFAACLTEGHAAIARRVAIADFSAGATACAVRWRG